MAEHGANVRAAVTLYLQDPDVELHLGDALEVLQGLPDESVHCVATSPPFFGLRDYGVAGQIGLESSPDEWAARLVAVFREARRVLRADGSLWVECGDSYTANGSDWSAWKGGQTFKDRKPQNRRSTGVKPKDLIGQPFLLAFALRADGWYWRGCNIWAKPNAMPESAKDRCTVAHSYVLHFSKSARYWFDGDAISEPAAWERWGDQTTPKHEGTETAAGWMRERTKEDLQALGLKNGQRSGAHGNRADDRQREFLSRTRLTLGATPAAKHPRSVWTIPTQGFPEAHFATWPEALARRIILAAVPEGGTVLDPFAGSGTTAYVARKLGRRAIGIDLNEEYLEMAARRLQQQSLFADANG